MQLLVRTTWVPGLSPLSDKCYNNSSGQRKTELGATYDVFVHLTLFLSLCVLGGHQDADKIHGISKPSTTVTESGYYPCNISTFLFKCGHWDYKKQIHFTLTVYIFSFTISK